MKILNINQASIVKLKTTDPLHFSGEKRKPLNDDVSSSFSEMLDTFVNKVNNLQVESGELTEKMITEPGSVGIHTVMIAAQKAEVAMQFTKSIRDEAIRSFRELMSLR